MRMLIPILLVLSPVAGLAQDEDALHRADRERTEQLNRRAAIKVDDRDDANARSLARYRDARAVYERERAEWRRRVAACQSGDDRACDPRER